MLRVQIAPPWLAMAFITYHDDYGNTDVCLFEYGNNLSAWLEHRLFTKPYLYYASDQPLAFAAQGVLTRIGIYPKPLELQIGGKGTQPLSLDVQSDWGE
ncbi:MAG: hypothetical protein ACJA13_001608 [Paraglaciecola sp.]